MNSGQIPSPLTTDPSRPWSQLYDGWVTATAPRLPASDLASAARAGLLARGDAPALHYFDTPVSARQLDADSDALACAFVEHGVGHGDRVALFLQNVPQFVVAALATWKLGATVVAVNPMFRREEVAKLLVDCRPAVLIALDTLRDEIPDDPAGPVVLTTSAVSGLAQPLPALLVGEAQRGLDADQLAAVVDAHRGHQPPQVAVESEDIAIIAYTSGTTGPPKGAMLSHANVLSNVETVRVWRQVGPDDTLLAMSPLFHVTGLVLHLAISLVASIPMVLGFRFEAGTMLELIERHRATYTTAAVTAYIALLEHPDFRAERVSSLTTTVSGGAPTPPAVIERYQQAAGSYLYNGYGLTETASPSHQVPSANRAPTHPSAGTVAIGIPIPGVDCRLVDDAGADVGVGAPGELLIRGPNVFKGYWGRPDETEAAFVDGYVRTGDVAERDDAGWFYLVDRKKDQINAAGYKVWPLEVEQVLFRHPAVREAAVVGVPDGYRGETVKAFVTLREGASATPQELIEFCRARMAAYKYPRQVELLTELPKSAAGKVLRRELRSRTAD